MKGNDIIGKWQKREELDFSQERKLRIKIALLFVLISFSPLIFAKNRLKDLPAKYRMWLERDARYIITDRERDVFLKLKTNKERNFFIKMFWKMRDPTPGTPKNEFKEEHYRRLAMAEKLFRDEGMPGWKTDRGKIYIILGKPQDIERYDGMGKFYPAEVWYYQGAPARNLPPQFRIVFYQETGTMEYKLYYPGIDGPQKIIPNYAGNPFNNEEGYNIIKQYEPALANALMSLIPGEAPTNYSSARSSLIISQIERSAYENVNTEYADKILNMKGIVEVEASTIYVPNQSEIEIFKNPQGFYTAHFSISPKKFSIISYGDNYYTALEVYSRVVNQKGETMWEQTNLMELNFTPSQVQRLKRSSVQIEGVIPVVKGKYDVTILLKNKTSKEFSAIEKRIKVPGEKDFVISSLGMSNSFKEVSPGIFIKPFRAGNIQFYPYSDKTFRSSEEPVLYGEVNLPKGNSPRSVRLKIHLEEEEGKYKNDFLSKISDPTIGLFYCKFGKLPPGSYTATVFLYYGDLKMDQRETDFLITPLYYKPTPFIISKIVGGNEFFKVYLSLAKQWYNTGNFERAEKYYKKVFNLAKDKAPSIEGLMETYFQMGKKENVLKVFASSKNKTSYMCYIAGKVLYEEGNLKEAIKVLEQGFRKNSVDLRIINLLAEAHLKAGNKTNARLLFKRSLSIDPKQEVIRKELEALR